jgi:hypothetical protein
VALPVPAPKMILKNIFEFIIFFYLVKEEEGKRKKEIFQVGQVTG